MVKWHRVFLFGARLLCGRFRPMNPSTADSNSSFLVTVGKLMTALDQLFWLKVESEINALITVMTVF